MRSGSKDSGTEVDNHVREPGGLLLDTENLATQNLAENSALTFLAELAEFRNQMELEMIEEQAKKAELERTAAEGDEAEAAPVGESPEESKEYQAEIMRLRASLQMEVAQFLVQEANEVQPPQSSFAENSKLAIDDLLDKVQGNFSADIAEFRKQKELERIEEQAKKEELERRTAKDPDMAKVEPTSTGPRAVAGSWYRRSVWGEPLLPAKAGLLRRISSSVFEASASPSASPPVLDSTTKKVPEEPKEESGENAAGVTASASPSANPSVLGSPTEVPEEPMEESGEKADGVTASASPSASPPVLGSPTEEVPEEPKEGSREKADGVKGFLRKFSSSLFEGKSSPTSKEREEQIKLKMEVAQFLGQEANELLQHHLSFHENSDLAIDDLLVKLEDKISADIAEFKQQKELERIEDQAKKEELQRRTAKAPAEAPAMAKASASPRASSPVLSSLMKKGFLRKFSSTVFEGKSRPTSREREEQMKWENTPEEIERRAAEGHQMAVAQFLGQEVNELHQQQISFAENSNLAIDALLDKVGEYFSAEIAEFKNQKQLERIEDQAKKEELDSRTAEAPAMAKVQENFSAEIAEFKNQKELENIEEQAKKEELDSRTAEAPDMAKASASPSASPPVLDSPTEKVPEEPKEESGEKADGVTASASPSASPPVLDSTTEKVPEEPKEESGEKDDGFTGFLRKISVSIFEGKSSPTSEKREEQMKPENARVGYRMCTLCDDNDTEGAVMYCKTCDQYLCGLHKMTHLKERATKGHTTEPYGFIGACCRCDPDEKESATFHCWTCGECLCDLHKATHMKEKATRDHRIQAVPSVEEETQATRTPVSPPASVSASAGLVR